MKLPWTWRYKGCESSSPNILERYIRNEAGSFKVIEVQGNHTKLHGKEFFIIMRLLATWAKRSWGWYFRDVQPEETNDWGSEEKVQPSPYRSSPEQRHSAFCRQQGHPFRPHYRAHWALGLAGIYSPSWPQFQTDSHSITSCVSPKNQWLSPLSRPTIP